MRILLHTLFFAALGLAFSLAVAGLASWAPNLFGWFTLPFWILPGLANLGAHDVAWPLMLLSGTICYGFVAFLGYSSWQRMRITLRQAPVGQGIESSPSTHDKKTSSCL